MDDLDLGATIKGFSPGQKVFNRYTLTKILGRGGMGVVWLARDEELGRDTALKFLPEIIAADRDAIEDLKREVRRAIDLAHPHIVKIHDFVTDGRMAAVSMEYVKGQTLAALRHDEPGRLLPLAKLTPWVAQLCSALTYAHHDAQVVHRDLKPANLMIDDRGRLKVLDFGIAASVSDSVSRVSQQAGSSGTPVYMSPQQMMGDKPAVTDDLYALGATLYDLLAGKPPFASGNIMLQVLNKAAPPLAEKRAELGLAGEPIPPEWEATIMACLAKEPKDRPQSAEEVLQRLRMGDGGVRNAPTQNQNFATDATGRTDKVGQPGRAGRDAGAQSKIETPNSKMPALVGLVAGLILLGGLGYYFGMHAPEQRRQAAEAETRRVEAERASAEQARLAAARGGIVVRTNPAGAEVRVGAVALDKSPLNLKDQRLGKYPVRIRLDGYEDWDGEVEVKENEFADLNVSLVRSTGGVILTSTPAGAQVRHEGRLLGVTPLRLTDVPTGKVAYELSLDDYVGVAVEGTVERGRSVALAVQLDIVPRFLALDAEGQLIPLARDGTSGRVLGAGRWDRIYVIDNDRLMVKKRDRWGLIDRTGRIAVEPVWEAIDRRDDWIQAKREGKWGLIDRNGRVVSPHRWEQYIGIPSEGLATVSQGDINSGKWGFIDKEGRVVIETLWEYVFSFSEGLAAVKRDGKWGFIDRSGRIALDPQWVEVEEGFKEGLAAGRAGWNDKWSYIDKTGRKVFEIEASGVGAFYDGLARIRAKSGNWGYIDRSGRIVIEAKWSSARRFYNNRAVVISVGEGKSLHEVKPEDWEHHLIDRSGNILSDRKWSSILEPISQSGSNLSSVSNRENKKGWIDWGTGQVAIEPQWDDSYDFRQGYASVQRGGMWGVIDQTGKVVVEPIWKFVVPLPAEDK